MSGGSFNYLSSSHGIADLATKISDLENMADVLTEVGYAADAAQDTADLLRSIRATDARVAGIVGRLEDVWRAVEWWKSGDGSEEDLMDALAVYRGEKPSRRVAYMLTPEEVAVVSELRKQAKGTPQ